MEESTILETNFILLALTKSRDLEFLLSTLAKEENIRFESVEDAEDLNGQQPDDYIITFIIGSDVEDPIQSAQRLHAVNNRAKIILITKPDNIKSLKETVKFSPFIGTNVFCLDESNEEKLEKRVKEILRDSLKAEKYRSVVEETNAQVSSATSPPKAPFNQQFVNQLMDIAPIGIAIVSAQGNVLGWNKKATSIFYKNEAQILGTPLYKYFEPKESEKLRRYLSKSAEKRKPGAVNSLTLERKTPDLSIRILSLTAAPFSYAEGTQKALILAIKDITEQKRAEEDLQQMNETLEERVAKRTSSLLSYQKQLRSLASQLYKTEEKERHRLAAELHDNLGQMLAVSKMKASLLLNQVSGKALSGVEEIKQSLDDAIVFTRDLMSDLKPPPSLDKEDIRAAIEWLAKKMKKHDLKVVLEDDGQPKKTTEEVQTTLIQAVRELLFNVIKHAKVQEAFVSMSRLDNQVQIIVEDKGEGADIDITTSSSTEKGGFGLFNIKERMDLLGGSFEIDSVPGEGTRVKLLAPLKDDDISADDAAPKAAEKSEKKIKVMLVDDHKMVRKGLKKVVDTENDMVVVAEASDGKEAIASARKTSPDVIIMDVDMPHINGIDATREIMSILPAVRVVGLSSMDDDREVMESMRNAGATAYLSKSEAFETLSATIRSEANK